MRTASRAIFRPRSKRISHQIEQYSKSDARKLRCSPVKAVARGTKPAGTFRSKLSMSGACRFGGLALRRQRMVGPLIE